MHTAVGECRDGVFLDIGSLQRTPVHCTKPFRTNRSLTFSGTDSPSKFVCTFRVVVHWCGTLTRKHVLVTNVVFLCRTFPLLWSQCAVHGQTILPKHWWWVVLLCLWGQLLEVVHLSWAVYHCHQIVLTGARHLSTVPLCFCCGYGCHKEFTTVM